MNFSPFVLIASGNLHAVPREVHEGTLAPANLINKSSFTGPASWQLRSTFARRKEKFSFTNRRKQNILCEALVSRMPEAKTESEAETTITWLDIERAAWWWESNSMNSLLHGTCTKNGLWQITVHTTREACMWPPAGLLYCFPVTPVLDLCRLLKSFLACE